MSKTNNYQVEVNINFCFYVDVDCIDEEEAKKEALSLAYDKAEEIVGDGNDEAGMIYGIGQPVVESVERLDDCNDDEDEDENEKGED